MCELTNQSRLSIQEGVALKRQKEIQIFSDRGGNTELLNWTLWETWCVFRDVERKTRKIYVWIEVFYWRAVLTRVWFMVGTVKRKCFACVCLQTSNCISTKVLGNRAAVRKMHCVLYLEIEWVVLSQHPCSTFTAGPAETLGELKGKYIQWIGNNTIQQWKQRHIISRVVFRGWRTNALDINSRSKRWSYAYRDFLVINLPPLSFFHCFWLLADPFCELGPAFIQLYVCNSTRLWSWYVVHPRKKIHFINWENELDDRLIDR